MNFYLSLCCYQRTIYPRKCACSITWCFFNLMCSALSRIQDWLPPSASTLRKEITDAHMTLDLLNHSRASARLFINSSAKRLSSRKGKQTFFRLNVSLIDGPSLIANCLLLNAFRKKNCTVCYEGNVGAGTCDLISVFAQASIAIVLVCLCSTKLATYSA